MNVFARRYGATYYSDIVTQQGRPSNDFHQMYVNLSLLGIDTNLVKQKADVKNKQNKLEKAKGVIEEYEKLFSESNVNDLKDELELLKNNKENFIIAENYDKYKKEADRETATINKLRTEIHNINKKISRKLESLDQSKVVNIDLDKVKRVYDEARFFFEDKITIRLEEAKDFHHKLMKNRVNRLEAEANSLKDEVKIIEAEKEIKEKHRDSILRDLDSKGALEEYNSINERIRTLDGEIQDLEKYKNVLAGFKVQESALTLENAKIMAESISYLNESKEYLEVIEHDFRKLVKRFYTNSGGTFEITNTKDAKYLYNIDVHVPRDASQGVNEVKIFCYDLLLYKLNPELLGFIAHDGCIFSEMDPRQKSMIFKVALEYIHYSDLQYFINIGQASLEEILDKEEVINILTSEEKAEIKDSIILELYDEDPSEWLLGARFG